MNILNNPPVRTYYIAHTPETGVVHNGYVDPGQNLTANQSSFETFEDEELYAARLTELGQTYDSTLDLTQAPAATQRILLNAEVNRIRAMHLELPVTFQTRRFDSDAESITNLNGVLAAIGAGLPLPANFTWRSADNENVPMNAQSLVHLAATFMTYRNKCYGASWATKAALAASATPLSINLEVGWPDPANPMA